MTVLNFKRLFGLLVILGTALPALAEETTAPASQLFPAELSRNLGLQDTDQGALPNDFWEPKPAADILPLIDALPAHQPLNIAQQLQLRLLLSNARPPAGATPQDWLAHRLQKLVTMRAYHQAAQLYYLAWRNQPMPESVQLALATLHIAANEADAACLIYLSALTDSRHSDWQYIQSYCASIEPALISPVDLPNSDQRTAMIAQLKHNPAIRSEFADAMLPHFIVAKLTADDTADNEKTVVTPIIGAAWLQENATGQASLMYLHGLIALAEGGNKTLVQQRWRANDLTDEASSLSTGKLPTPPPEE